MTKFQRYSDFLGRYEGSHDGRRARLTIGDTKADSPWPTFLITLEDLDRNQEFRNLHQQRSEASDGKHVLTNINLTERHSGHRKRYRKLYLHTWDTDYLTGISVWRNREFGASFERV